MIIRFQLGIILVVINYDKKEVKNIPYKERT